MKRRLSFAMGTLLLLVATFPANGAVNEVRMNVYGMT